MKTVSLVGALVVSALLVGCIQDDLGVDGETGEEIAAQESGVGPPLVSEYESREWQIRAEAVASVEPLIPVFSGVTYTLFNSTLGQYIKYGSRNNGINLVWSQSESLGMSLESTHGLASSVSYGEVVAIKIEGHGYLKYGARDEGVNLRWSDTPVYEWQIRRGVNDEWYDPEHPQALGTVQSIQLYNVELGDQLVYCQRECGINLAWRKTCLVTNRHRRVPALPFVPCW